MSSIFARNDVLGALYATNGVSPRRCAPVGTILISWPNSYGSQGQHTSYRGAEIQIPTFNGQSLIQNQRPDPLWLPPEIHDAQALVAKKRIGSRYSLTSRRR
jgi:hypothetical protein